MTIHYTILGKYLTELYAVKSIEERFQIFGQYIQILGFTGATYTFAPTLQIEALPQLPAVFLYTDTFPIGFLQAYSQERFDRKDFTVRKVLNGETKPMDWREHELQGVIHKEEAELIRLARERYGILNAISIPTMHENKGSAGVSVISTKQDEMFQQLKREQMGTLLCMVRLFHETNFYDKHWSRQFIAPVFASLTDREKKILHYLAEGNPMKRIGDDIGLDKSASENTLSLLKKRLGIPTTNRLMYLFGLLSDLYDIPRVNQLNCENSHIDFE